MTLLICASDAGGARNLAPVAALAAERGEAVTVLGSTATLPLFAEAGVRAEVAALADIAETTALLQTWHRRQCCAVPAAMRRRKPGSSPPLAPLACPA